MSWLLPDYRPHGRRHGGLRFCGCAIAPGGPAAAPRRGPTIVRGRRARVIDTHAHCYFQDALDLMGADAKGVLPPVRGVPEHFLAQDDVLRTRLDAMERMGVDLQVLSINPFWYRKDRDTAEAICRIHNERLAELCAREPKRFAAFASLAMQHPDLAVRQLEHAVRELGLKGAAIGGSVDGRDFAHAEYHPVLAKAQELGVTLFIHPQSTPQLAERFRGNGWLSNVIGNPLDTTIALQKLIFEGVLDRFPDLKVLAAHGGGFLGSYAPRMDRSCAVSPQNGDPAIVLRGRPTEYLRRLHFDALVFTPEALRHLVAEVGASQVVVGTDHPIPWEEDPVGHVMSTPELSDDDRLAILGGNAARLLGLDP